MPLGILIDTCAMGEKDASNKGGDGRTHTRTSTDDRQILMFEKTSLIFEVSQRFRHGLRNLCIRNLFASGNVTGCNLFFHLVHNLANPPRLVSREEQVYFVDENELHD